MNEHPIGTILEAQRACQTRAWIHSVGIINTLRDVDHAGRRDWETNGTGSLGCWGNHHFILTAKHVIQPDAKPSDLRLFWRPFGDDKYLADSDLQAEHITSGLSIKDPNARIIRCDWEDLAIIEIDSSQAGQYSEFVDIATDWVDPSVDEVVHVFGYPADRHIVVGDQLVSQSRREVTVAIRPDIFSGKVMSSPSFPTRDFIADRHYLVPYDHATSEHPRGFSGAAAWWEPADPQQVWRPNFKFAGVCTHCYERRSPILERIVKASAVRQFLEEELGSTDS
jgi:Trypsin-like peptidase domain